MSSRLTYLSSSHRRRSVGVLGALASLTISLLIAGCAVAPSTGTAATIRANAEEHAEVGALLGELASQEFEDKKLTSLVAQVMIDGESVDTVAYGEAMTGFPVTAEGRFRNGAVAIMYVAATMLAMADAGLMDIDEPISRWLPDLPDADQATPRMLASMTSGYPDHLANADFLAAQAQNPFRAWTEDELLAYSAESQRLFAPGANWDYSHAGYIILGHVLEAAGDAPLEDLISQYVLDPLKLEGTVAGVTAHVPSPVVHGFTAERGIFEDSTYWNPSWTLPHGAIETTTIDDMTTSFDAIVGRGELLTPESYQALISTDLIGFGAPLEGCRSCHTLTSEWTYGLGVFLRDDWVMQTPLFGGYQAAVATLPEAQSPMGAVTISVSIVPGPQSYSTAEWDGALANYAANLATELGRQIVPQNPPPVPTPAH
ncbi:CubicO group peptidase (beta-lactamase class C family) [Leucobacter exalbidus]|uniref:CubicO group peptidase (Beta-lactamase class C family) n=1 Tax=Leucobacter exalbidus TaxID=662960 RepID=A0A940T4E8_9MICO|nr:serine hydrolase domain-containing protein [Leucobacter exalbidus]MBP1324886.1 CubicO group peptidase (beta-lactamase class C family) [Leucobacter exalbidus]